MPTNDTFNEAFRIYRNVKLGKNVSIGDYAVIGIPPKGKSDGELETVISDGAIIRSHTVIYSGNRIGRNFQTGHGTLIRENNIIGDNVSIGSHSVVEFETEIHDDVRIHSQAFVPEKSILCKGSWLGPNAVLTNAKYPLSSNVKQNLRGVVLGKGAKVGANATILPAIRIGDGSLVGAGSVVTRDVPDGIVVAGNPAKEIRKIEDIDEYQI